MTSRVKAAPMKMFIAFVGYLAGLPSFQSDDEIVKVASVCAYSLAKFVRVLDVSPYWMSVEQANSAHRAGRMYLQCWQFLSGHCLRNDIFNFHIRPKHHYFDHHVEHVKSRRINPRLMSCLLGEDLLGKIKRIAKSTHGRTTATRFRQRYLVFLDFRWRKRRRRT